MSTFKEQVMNLIKQRQGIREDEIAAELECDLDEIYPAIRIETQQRQVLVEKVDGPGGRKFSAYRMNPAFLGWSTAGAASSVATDSTVAAVVDDARSKVDKAIDFLKANNGRASSAQLKKAMGLKDEYTPSQYLGPATRSGKVARDGEDWVLGAGAAAAEKRVAPASRPIAVPAAAPVPASKTVKPTRPVKPAHIPQDAVRSSLSIGDLKIIQWKSGNLAISANDNTVDLQPAQAKALTAFVELTQ